MQIYTKITEKVQDNFDLFGVASVHWCNRIDNDDNDDMIFHQHWSQFGSSISFNGGSAVIALHNFTHHGECNSCKIKRIEKCAKAQQLKEGCDEKGCKAQLEKVSEAQHERGLPHRGEMLAYGGL